LSERDTPLAVTLDLELPDNCFCAAEIELLEVHLAELMRELLFPSEIDEE
jgi:hypothetical protein